MTVSPHRHWLRTICRSRWCWVRLRQPMSHATAKRARCCRTITAGAGDRRSAGPDGEHSL